ncbi:MAG: capsular polysaccharide biosynthesis protein [Rhizobiaceae bacterium]|nr:capsular polysaccharide biosynthesis protein [Rhizobiaceae bacterium]
MTGSRPVLAVTSPGLWAQRREIETVLDADIRFFPAVLPFAVDGFVGWGGRASGLRARRLARRFGKPVVILEDGFLKSYAPGRAEPAHSYVADRSGIYFDASRPSDLDGLIDRGVTGERAARARAAIDFIRGNQLSKYNNSPLLPLSDSGLPAGRPFVLIVDQVPGDASIAGALADDSRFGDMVDHARRAYPDAVIAVRTHPAAGDRSLVLAAARRIGVDVVATARMNPWPLLEAAEAVYTISSQLGFEALMAGRTVHAFGATYYSHRGLTIDHCPSPAPRATAGLEQVFHAAFIDYSYYLDLHDRRPVELEHALDQLLTVRSQRNQITHRVYTGGLSPWKRRALDPFVVGPAGRAVHCRSMSQAEAMARAHGGQVALWGTSRPFPAEVPAMRFEDGFIRSRGLGANLALPCSLAMDWDHVYYDARGESRLEHIIAHQDYSPALLDRSARLIASIVEKGVSKYNVGDDVTFPAVEAGRLRILVPGQVEKDASIRYGSPVTRTNHALVAAVRALHPDAYLAYKEHPDVTSGVRAGGEVPDAADIVIREGDIKHWIAWCDRVETMTSLAGFEALIRDKPVGVHGIPFYAGWGLTDDRLPVPRRTRRVSVEMLAAAALILYPFYVHPLSGLPCRVEELVEEIGLRRQVRVPLYRRLMLSLSQSINRSAVKIRDRRA